MVSMKQEHSHCHDLSGHRGPFGGYKDPYLGELSDIFNGENEEEIGEEDAKHFGPRKKLNIGNFNTFKNELLEDVIKQEEMEKLKVKMEIEEAKEKKEKKEKEKNKEEREQERKVVNEYIEEASKIYETTKRKKKGKNDAEKKEEPQKTKAEPKKAAPKKKKN